ncbi:hypothetical protein SAMN04515679_0004 [Pelosinus fermentans]|nr:hypothetical protein FR7_04618 [Pelosinus fermentans DSM 17108]SDQ03026.1 hypothetical protein SAMN04515679_0004 [Pelosinus fermentans]
MWLFEGILNSLKTTIAEFSCVVERDTVDFSQEGPNMDYGPTCQFIYKGQIIGVAVLVLCLHVTVQFQHVRSVET